MLNHVDRLVMRTLRALALTIAIVVGCRPALAEELPNAVNFDRDVMPILSGRCVRCHGRGQAKGGFKIDSRNSILKGGDSGATIVVGHADRSLLIELVSGKDADRIMPVQGTRLTEQEIAHLRAWIDGGLTWPEQVSFARPTIDQSLTLAPPELPAVSPDAASTNPIDLLLQSYFQDHAVPRTSSLVDDRTFARRAYLDVIGLLPTPAQLDVFLAEPGPDKRERLVARLLADSKHYAEHWLTFWNDVLRNDYQGTGYIDGGRQQITNWLYAALANNMPYDQFVRELINPSPESEGFTKGIVWRGVVNASQVPAMQAAQNIGQIFLGANLKCASCHDSFINAWKLSDSYGLAAVYSDEPLEIHKCDKPTGKVAETAFLFPSLGQIDATKPRPQRLEQLAALITSPQNGRLPRTIVNRLWDRFFGRGLIEPVDEMENDAWNAALLEWLAADLVAHGSDLKHTISTILSSRAYQLPAVGGTPNDDDFVFRGPLVRRLSAEQFVDAVSQLTGQWQSTPAVALTLADADHQSGTGANRRYASGILKTGSVPIDVDIHGARTLWLVVTNGAEGTTYDWADWCEPEIIVSEKTVDEKTVRLTDLAWRSATSGHNTPRVDKNVVGGPLSVDGRPAAFGIGTHGYSVITYELPVGATRFRATVGPDQAAVDASATGHEIEFLVLTDVQVRAVMVAADPLMKALGRPNREQVVTRRPSITTTLEALELNNGSALDHLLKQGAAGWLAKQAWQPRELADAIYRSALGRPTTTAEAAAAIELLGTPPTAEGVEDFCWSIIMLPEFQLIP